MSNLTGRAERINPSPASRRSLTRVRIKPRERIRIKQPQQSKRSEAKKPLRYSYMQRDFANVPAKYGLSVTETAVLLGLLAEARKKDWAEKKAIALKAGAKEREEKRIHGGSVKYRKDFARQTARNGFHLKMQKLQKLRPPEILCFDITRTSLLRASGLSCDTRSIANIDAILRRLRSIIVEGKPAPLVKCKALGSGKLRLYVASEWIEPPYVKVPLPLPTRSLAAVNLHLFLRCTTAAPLTPSKTPTKSGWISLDRLCEIIGIDLKQDRFVRRRSVRRAIKAVNSALVPFDGEPSSEAEHRKVPWFYVMMISENDRIHFRQAHKMTEIEFQRWEANENDEQREQEVA